MRVRLAIAALLLAGCSTQPADSSAVTADEDRQLNAAAESLEANALAVDPQENAE